jgi:hypothetical protein
LFADMKATITPSLEGVASLVEKGVLSPQAADEMRSAMALQQKLPGHYAVTGAYSGVTKMWLAVEAQWDGKPLNADPTAEIAKAVEPLQVRYQGFEDGCFMWVVEAPDPATEETDAPAKARGRQAAA